MANKILKIPSYSVELWSNTGVYVADVSDIISTDLSISFSLNDVEQIGFSLDLVQFEAKCARIGAVPRNILDPYRTEVRIRRDDVYLVGGQVVYVQANFNNQSANIIEVRCTGYLNYFKDRYITPGKESSKDGSLYVNRTYAQIARQLVIDTQASYNYVLNGSFTTDATGWSYDGTSGGSIARNTSAFNTTPASLSVIGSAPTTGTRTARYSVILKQGNTYDVSAYVRKNNVSTSSTVFVYAYGQNGAVGPVATISGTTWTKISFSFSPSANTTFLGFSSTTGDFLLDDVVVELTGDNTTRRDFGVTLGVDTASPFQNATRSRIDDYDNQNVKDGIINLTKLEADNFDFKFSHDKVLNIYSRLGSDKPEIELVYPQNIYSMTVGRDASTLANKIKGIGSGMGEERLESTAVDGLSALAYKVREKIPLFNNVSTQSVLDNNTIGTLYEYTSLYESLALSLHTNVINPTEVNVGDAITIRVDGSTFIDSVFGLYRIIGMDLHINKNSAEDISLKVIQW